MSHRFVIGTDEARARIDKVLAQLLPGTSRATVQRWIAEERVLVNGAPCRARDLVGPGAVLEVFPSAPPPSRAEPDPSVVLDVVFEDEHLLVVDKPAGLVVHPARGHATGTLVNGLLARPEFTRLPADPNDPEGPFRPGIVHRLDKDTSGVLVVAKDEPTREGLKQQLAAHSVERVYTAITVGVPAEGRIETLHGRHPQSRLKFSSKVREGRQAVTQVTVQERLSVGAAVVECRLETGRTHQIRVHLSEVRRTPVLGDALYGGRTGSVEVQRVAATMNRHALHAGVLGFVHPVRGESLRFSSPLPSELESVLRELRGG